MPELPTPIRSPLCNPPYLNDGKKWLVQSVSKRDIDRITAVGSTYGNYFCVNNIWRISWWRCWLSDRWAPPLNSPLRGCFTIRSGQKLNSCTGGQARGGLPHLERKLTHVAYIKVLLKVRYTTGSPIMIKVPNTDQRGKDYIEMSMAHRPSHADAIYDFKYGTRSVEGGGRSSARETIRRAASGAVAKEILKAYSGTEILAYVSQAQKVVLPVDPVGHQTLTLDQLMAQYAQCQLFPINQRVPGTVAAAKNSTNCTFLKRFTELVIILTLEQKIKSDDENMQTNGL
ncbi:Chorismate synthase [Cynara cardunculus var. scolymus]|uniref:chorismate synthase n=1 Tax=Cynara cardunculus var. scolymus TaxID=59895 RepID=A0A118K5X5_CYNCS|nr:Chorismate synthase [Cynara cardunculus var. scolymus]